MFKVYCRKIPYNLQHCEAFPPPCYAIAKSLVYAFVEWYSLIVTIRKNIVLISIILWCSQFLKNSYLCHRFLKYPYEQL